MLIHGKELKLTFPVFIELYNLVDYRASRNHVQIAGTGYLSLEAFPSNRLPNLSIEN